MSAFYHSLTKNVIGCFGQLFSDIHVIRRYQDTRDGPALQDIKVPISYAPKMKWWQALTSDPSRQKQTNVTLPRMSFEILGYTYDASRKKTRSSDIRCVMDEGEVISVGTPAPWNIDMALYIVANNQEDVLQIMEQILPLFNPDYTVKIKAIPQLNIISNVPISLSNISIQDDYEGEYTSHRLVVYTLSFTIKMEYYGEVKEQANAYTVEFVMGNGTDTGHYVVSGGDLIHDVIIDQWDWDSINEEEVNITNSSIKSDRYMSPHVEITEQCKAPSAASLETSVTHQDVNERR